jgi:hypothetical protein
MITYKVVQGAPGYGWFVIAAESGAVVAGPFTSQEQAQTAASVKAGTLAGLARS